MLFNFSWLYRFAMEENININQLDVFEILFFENQNGYDQGTCSNRIRGKCPLTREMLRVMEDGDGRIPVKDRVKKIQLSNIDDVCKKISVLLLDPAVTIDSQARKELLKKYSDLYCGQREDKRIAFIAEALKTAVKQSDAKKHKLPDWIPCDDANLARYQEQQKKPEETQCPEMLPQSRLLLEEAAQEAVELSRRELNQEALKIRKYVLLERQKLYAPESEEVLLAEANLASTYSKLGRNMDALELREHVLKERRKQFAPESEKVLRAEVNLATTYNKLGRYSDALPLRRHVLETRKNIYPPNHPLVLKAEANLAATLSKLEQHTRGE